MAGPSVVVEMSSDEAKLMRGLQRLVEQNQKLEKSFGDVANKGKKAGEDGAAGFNSLASGAASALASVLTVDKAIQTVVAGFKEMERLRSASADYSRTLRDARVDLADVSGGSAARMRQLDEQAAKASAQYGIDPVLSRQLLFGAVSGGYERDWSVVARYAALNDPTSVGGIANKLPKQFPGLSVVEALEMTKAAAVQSESNFATIAGVAPIATGGGKDIGASPEETLAILSTLPDQFTSANEVAMRMRAFGSQMGLKGYRGQGFLGTVRSLQAMPDEERSQVLGGSMEVNAAYREILAQMDLIVERERAIAAARAGATSSSSLIAQQEQALSGLSVSTEIEQERRLARELETQRESMLSSEELRRQNLLSAMDIELEQSRGGPTFDAMARRRAAEAAGLVGASPELSGEVYERSGLPSWQEHAAAMVFPPAAPLIYGSGALGRAVDPQQDVAAASERGMQRALQRANGTRALASPDVDK